MVLLFFAPNSCSKWVNRNGRPGWELSVINNACVCLWAGEGAGFEGTVLLLSLKYCLHIHNDKDPKTDDRFSFQSILNTNDIAFSYNNQLNFFFEIIGFEHIWQNKETFFSKLIHADKSKLLERYNIFFKKSSNRQHYGQRQTTR